MPNHTCFACAMSPEQLLLADSCNHLPEGATTTPFGRTRLLSDDGREERHALVKALEHLAGFEVGGGDEG